jgi:predicted dehydrogenase
MKTLSRRRFLQSTAAATTLPCIVRSSVFGVDAPSNKITVGFIGTGDHGTGWNLDRYLKLPAAKVVMVCDVDGYRMRKAKAMVDAKYDTEDCAVSKDFRDVLARKDIDAVMISTPDHWHTLISLMALRAGKDVQCEKPTLTIQGGEDPHQDGARPQEGVPNEYEDRSLPMYHRMAELVRNGRIGKLQRIEVILPQQPNFAGDATPQPVRTILIGRCGWVLPLRTLYQTPCSL